MGSQEIKAENKAAHEARKRQRERLLVLFIGCLFLLLTWIEFRLLNMSETLPFVHSIFFFGLVNFNIILFLLLTFLIFRNIVKVFSEREGGIAGTTLKSKLIAAFVAFSFVPTTLMFLVSVFYINNSFDKWFSEKMSGVLKSSLEVTNAYYLSAKKRNYHFAHTIGEQLQDLNKYRPEEIKSKLQESLHNYRLDSIEFYPGLFEKRVFATSEEETIPDIPPVSMEFLQKGLSQKAEASGIHHFGDGNLIRVIVPAKVGSVEGAVVVSSFIPLSLITKMDDIASAYGDFRDIDPLAYPIKSIYLIILAMMTLVILLCATWFGFYLARQLSIPLENLSKAAKRLVKGDYTQVPEVTGSKEIRLLVQHFNQMTSHLDQSQREIQSANTSLRETLATLDEHSRYIEVVLANVSTGVISINEKGVLTMVNRHAAKLLDIRPKAFIGKTVKEVLNKEHFGIFSDLLRSLKKHNASSIQKEIRITVKGRPVPMQMSLSLLEDENKKEIGKVLVFNDLTMLVSAQRAAAWTEVARRIAHEIKNPLTPISLSAQRLQKKFGEDIKDPAFNECTNMIIDQVDDLKGLVNEFSSFARLPKSRPVLANLERVIGESISLFRQAHKNIKFEFLPDSQLPDFMFDPDQMKRVITNLVDNALSAVKTDPNGRVTVLFDYDNLLKIVRISISDNGAGIPKYLQDRIFEPYVTTKRHGTGLGLAIVKRTVEDHNGFIRAVDNKPTGTRIVIELPVILATTNQVVKANKETERST